MSDRAAPVHPYYNLWDPTWPMNWPIATSDLIFYYSIPYLFYSSLTILHPVPCTNQALSCLRAFALALPLDILTDSTFLFFRCLVKSPLLVEVLPVHLPKISTPPQYFISPFSAFFFLFSTYHQYAYILVIHLVCLSHENVSFRKL